MQTQEIAYQQVTIANGANLSAAINIVGSGIVRITTPSAWTAANLTFQVSHDGTTFNNLYDQYGSEYTVVAAASRAITLQPSDFAGFNYIKVRSGTSGTPVTQAADRSLILAVRSYS